MGRIRGKNDIMAVLQQIRGTTPFQIHRLNQSVTSLGRHESCDVVIDVPQVSRSHAIITRDQDDQYFVEDLQSRNGTKVNDRKISERTRLYDGDRLEISSHTWQFLCEHGSTRTGNWAHVPQEIAVAVCSDPHDAQSVRSVQQNDFICSEELNAAPFDQSGIITELPLDNPALLMPAAAANVCLRSVLQLIHALTPELSTDELVSELSSAIFRAIPAAERVAVILEDDSGAGVRVAGAFVRGPVDHLEISLALIRHGLNAARATMTAASCLQGSESP
ncbi:MAG: FHA domain-containing protein, partial [Planctomycetaceae bacterium]|nr:FHA domain-containing protein [Planctomycetaceae bacterium]